jgi:hypothetical protein
MNENSEVESDTQTYVADVIDPKVVRQKLKEYYLTPEELRAGPQSLGTLSAALGLEEGQLKRVLANTPEVANEVMAVVALAGMGHVPQVLSNLLQASNDGSVRASEVYLEWIRKVLQNEELLKHGGLGSNINVQVMVQNVEAATDRMLDFVKAVPEGAGAARQALADGSLEEKRRALLTRATVAVQDVENVPIDPRTVPLDMSVSS